MADFNLRTYLTKDKVYTHQSLSGGKYNIPDDKTKEFLTYCIENPKHCLCEKLPDKFPLYFDIDGLKEDEYEFEDVFEYLKESIYQYYETEDDLDIYVLYNKGKPNNYHIYVLNIITDKIRARAFCKLLNNDYHYGEEETYEIFDPKAYNSCFRMYGQYKYDRRNTSQKLNKKSIYVYHPDFNEKQILKLSELEKIDLVSIRNNMKDNITNITEKFKNEIARQNTAVSRKIIANEEGEVNIEECDEADESMEKNNKTKKNKYFYNELTKNNNDYLLRILGCINEWRLDNYEEWVKIIFIFKNTGLPKSELINWSKKSHKWDDNSLDHIDTVYKKPQTLEQRKVGYRSLLSMALYDNEVKYKKIQFAISKHEYFDLNVSLSSMRYYLNRNEKGLAELVYSLISERIIYSAKIKMFYFWDGDIWKEDETNIVNFLISDILEKSLYAVKYANDKALANNSTFLTEEEEKKLINLTNQIFKYGFVECVKKWFVTMAARNSNAELLNTNKDVISVANGLIELETGKLRPRYFNDYNTFYIETNYEGLDYDTTNIEKYFQDLMLERNDAVRYLQRFLGYSITGHTSEQIFSILNGNGSNGKSLTVQLLEDLLEENKYFASLSGEALTGKLKPGAATTMYNCLEGVRLAVLDESNKNQEINEGVIKRFTGQSKIKVRGLYKEERAISLYCQIALTTNFLPTISDDPALHRRIITIPFDAKFVDKQKFKETNKRHRLKKKDTEIRKTITAEALLVWLVQGSIQWYKEGLENIPDIIRHETDKFLKESDPMLEFISENCEPDSKVGTTLEMFIREYESFTKNTITLSEMKKEIKIKDIPMHKKGKKKFISYRVMNNNLDSDDED